MDIIEILNLLLRNLDKTDEFPFRMQIALERVCEESKFIYNNESKFIIARLGRNR